MDQEKKEQQKRRQSAALQNGGGVKICGGSGGGWAWRPTCAWAVPCSSVGSPPQPARKPSSIPPRIRCRVPMTYLGGLPRIIGPIVPGGGFVVRRETVVFPPGTVSPIRKGGVSGARGPCTGGNVASAGRVVLPPFWSAALCRRFFCSFFL